MESQLLREPATRATTLFKVHALYSGIAVTTDASRLAALAAIPGVKAIHVLTPKQRGQRQHRPADRRP